jgi:HPt (histidine-containing phosphotransfer) domain-containing protein
VSPITAPALEELTGGDPELAAILIGDFLESSVADAAALSTALDRLDAEDVRRQAHRIKGAARIVGAGDVARVAESLEAEAGKPECAWTTLDALAGELKAQLDRVHASSA